MRSYRRGHRNGMARIPTLALIALLAACSREQLPAPSGDAPAQVEAQQGAAVEGFGLAAARAAQWQGQLALELVFSEPLVGTQPFDELLAVRDDQDAAVEGSWALDEDGRTLRFPYVLADRTYMVRIGAGLAAANGDTLGDLERGIYTGPLAPAVAFASQGSVLPARGSRGLPVVAVNVPEVDVEFLRIRDTEVAQFFAAYQKAGKRGSWELDPRWGWGRRKGKPVAQIAEPVYANRFVLGGEANERSVDYLPVQHIEELARPGLYFAVMKRAGHFPDEYDTAFFFVSDIGLHLRAYEKQLFVHAASLKTGLPLEGVALEVLDANGEALVTGTTDSHGNASLEQALDASLVLTARSGRDVSLLPFNQPALDLSEFAVSGRGQAWFDVFAWSGRDLYRPGETLRVSALLRDHDGRAVPPQPLWLTLRQPDGRPFAEAHLNPDELGYFEWTGSVPADAPTGRWQVEFRTEPDGKAVQGPGMRIEEFLPERLKLQLDAPAGPLEPGAEMPLEVEGAHLYGAPAAGNRFTARLALSVDTAAIPALPGFRFGDPTVELPREAAEVVDAALDDAGHLATRIALPEGTGRTSPVRALITGSLHESGGRPVSRTLERSVWPAGTLVGIRPRFELEDGALPNARAAFEIVRGNAAGERLPAEGLEVTLLRERRDYRWSFDEQAGWQYDYSARLEEADRQVLTIPDGQAGAVDFAVEWGDYRLDVRDPASGLVTRLPFRAGWGSDDANRGVDARPDKVKLALDRTAYRAGDTLAVTVTAPHAGPGLLLVESDRLLHAVNIDARQGAQFEIPVTEDWERHDVYLTALVFRGGSATGRITPARAVGVAHVPMDRSARRVEVGLDAPARLRPQEPLPVSVRAPALAGKTARVTVSAVDVGILNITRFPVPDAFAWLFGQRALAVDALDLYGRVIESFEGGTARMRWGGDMALPILPQARRPTARVQTVDLFSGPVTLGPEGEATLDLQVPEFNGTLRVSALVFSEDHYGKAEAETVVRAPVVAEVSTPRVLAPGDEALLTLDLDNGSGHEQTLSVELTATPPLTLADGSRRLTLADGGRRTLEFPLRALQGNASGAVRVQVNGDGVAVDQRHEVPVRPGWGPELRQQARSQADLAPVTLGPELARGLVASSVEARLTVSAIAPLPYAEALQGLLAYPYGCVEQTAARGYAALILDAGTAAALGTPALPAAERNRRIEAAIGRIASMQRARGQFAMWAGASEASEFLTPVVAEFLLEASEAGFAMPGDVLQNALQRMHDDLLTGGHPYYGYDHPDHLRFAEQAWSAYVLARVNRAPLGTLRALFDTGRGKALTGLPLVQLGAALKLMGDEPRARQAVAEGLAKAREEHRPRWLGDYGSPLRDTALMLAIAHRHELARPADDGAVFDLALRLATRRGEDRLWLSTQEQLAIARLGRQLTGGGDAVVGGRLTVGGQSAEAGADRLWTRSFTATELASGVRFEPSGTPPLYVATSVAGLPMQAPPPDDSRVSIQRSWFTLDGRPWQATALAQGEGLIAMLTLEAREDMPDALVEDHLPGGLELENFNLTDPEQWGEVLIDGITIAERATAADLRHEEFRDDRYVAALDLRAGQKARLFYLVRAVSPGRYGVPPPTAHDMYRPTLRGSGHAVPGQIEVTVPRTQ